MLKLVILEGECFYYSPCLNLKQAVIDTLSADITTEANRRRY